MANTWVNSRNSGWVYFGGLQNHCRWWLQHEFKRCLLLGRKVMSNLGSILKQRNDFVNKCSSSQSYGFSIVMYGCENWTIEKAEHWRIDAFELWCWRRSLRVPWIARNSNWRILKKINAEYSLEGLDAEVETPIFWPLDVKNWLIGKGLDAG